MQAISRGRELVQTPAAYIDRPQDPAGRSATWDADKCISQPHQHQQQNAFNAGTTLRVPHTAKFLDQLSNYKFFYGITKVACTYFL